MKSIKRGMAVFLAVLLLIPDMPVRAGGEPSAAGAVSDIVQYNTGNGICTVVAAPKSAENPEIPKEGADGAETVTGSAVDVFGESLGEDGAKEDAFGGQNAEGETGGNPFASADGTAGEETSEDEALSADDFFAEDGSYTIRIPEPDPFFPYEVQFTYDGNVTNEWFMTPEDSVEIGGHMFYVQAEFSGTVVTRMSFDVAGDTVVVYPEEKEFPAEKASVGYSLLPLLEKSFWVDLTGYTPMELSMVKIANIFAGQKEFTDTDKIMWSYGENGDDFTVSMSGGTVDMRDYSEYQMIVGNDDQLDMENVRYIIRRRKANMSDWLIPSFYIQKEDGTRAEIQPSSSFRISVSEGGFYFRPFLPEIGNVDRVYVGLKLNPEKFANPKYDHVKVYEGSFKTLEDALSGREITNEIWETDMEQKDSGYSIESQEYASSYYAYYAYESVTLVTFDAEGNATGFHSFDLNLYVYPPDFGALDFVIYTQDSNAKRESIQVHDTWKTSDGSRIYTYVPKEKVKNADTLYIGLTGYDAETSSAAYDKLCAEFGCDHIKVYGGNYGTTAEALSGEEITEQIWNADKDQIDSGYPVAIEENQFSCSVDVTFVAFDAEDNAIWSYSVGLVVYLDQGRLSINLPKNEQGEDDIFYNSYHEFENGVPVYIWDLYADYKVDDEYFQSFSYQNAYGEQKDDAVLGAYVGNYATAEEAEKDEKKNIKDELFGSVGYKANYSETVYFTIFVQGGKTEEENAGILIYHFGILMRDSGRYKNYFSDAVSLEFEGLKDAQGNRVDCYIVNTKEDSYAEFNYLTILVDKDVDLSKLAPEFSISKGSKLYAAGSSTPEESGQSIHDFSGGSMQYTVSAENGENSKNYWLQIIKASEAQKALYVNSLADPEAKPEGIRSQREMMIDSYHNNVHDILLINMGTDVVTGAAVELISDTVELDDYWTLKGKLNLSGFDGTESKGNYDGLANMAKIRLRMKEGVEDGADISGTLTVKSSSEDLLVFTLTGTVGDPSITTTEIPAAVKYVPYGTMIQNSNKYRWNRVSYSLYDGELPEGMILKPNGELYGVPKETGTFHFTVQLENSGSRYDFGSSIHDFTLEIKENTNENVDSATDTGYDVTTRIQNLYVGDTRRDELFVSAGAFSQLVDVYLDGEKLSAGKDYTAESGSTRITIMAETLDEGLDEGTHTLGVEFRDEEDSLKRAAQNFDVVKRSSTGGNTGGSIGGGSTSGSSDGTVTPTPVASATPTLQPTVTLIPTATPVPTATPTPTNTPTPVPTATLMPTNTPTPAPTKRPDAGVPFVKDDMQINGWDAIKAQVEEASDGEVIVVDMNASTVVPGEVIEAATGKDVTLQLVMDEDIAWEINGNSVTSDEFEDIDFKVQTGENANEIPMEIVNNVTGERYFMNLTLAHEGDFGFTAVLRIDLGKKNAGLYANLFYYNEAADVLEFICDSQIDKAGIAELSFTHASDYTIVIDEKSMGEIREENQGDDEKEDGKKEDETSVNVNDRDLPKTALKDSVWFLFMGMLVILIGGCILLVTYDKKRCPKE